MAYFEIMAKKKHVKYAADSHTRHYMSVGHTGNSMVWAYVKGKLMTWNDSKAHVDVLGEDAALYWRGRYERSRNILTAIPPCSTKYKQAPQWLLDKLEVEFGGDFELYAFNPPKTRRSR